MVSKRTTILPLLLITLAGCAGYQFGPQTLYRPDIQTVYVPPVENGSFRRQLGERLTEAVVKEIEKRSIMKVVASPDADSTLRIRLISENKRVLAENRFDDPRDIETDFFIQASWEDSRGDLIGRSLADIPLPPSVINVSQQANFVPEGGQSIATAQQEAINGLAKQIVGILEAPW